MINVLILGSSGYIGGSLYNQFQKLSYINVYEANRECNDGGNGRQVILNIDDLSSLESFIKEKHINVVINCVAISNVEQCEKDYSYAKSINVEFVGELVSLINRQEIKLVHFSTNAVYCGDKAPYNELDNKEPKNKYGRLKALADDIIENNCNNYMIARIMTVFGKPLPNTRGNPADFIISRLKQEIETYLVTDVYNNMLYIEDLINVMTEAVRLDLSGSYNISGDETLNRYEFGCRIASVLSLDKEKLIPCTSDKFGSLSSRAFDTSFDNSKIKLEMNVKFSTIESAIRKAYL
jgi:dTDP-4-dehydrorhamnose reductase